MSEKPCRGYTGQVSGLGTFQLLACHAPADVHHNIGIDGFLCLVPEFLNSPEFSPLQRQDRPTFAFICRREGIAFGPPKFRMPLLLQGLSDLGCYVARNEARPHIFVVFQPICPTFHLSAMTEVTGLLQATDRLDTPASTTRLREYRRVLQHSPA